MSDDNALGPGVSLGVTRCSYAKLWRDASAASGRYRPVSSLASPRRCHEPARPASSFVVSRTQPAELLSDRDCLVIRLEGPLRPAPFDEQPADDVVRKSQPAEGFAITRIARGQPLEKSRGFLVAAGSFRRAIGPVVESGQTEIAAGRVSREIDIEGVTGRRDIYDVVDVARLLEPGPRAVGLLGADQVGEHTCPVSESDSVLGLVGQLPNEPLDQLPGSLLRLESCGAIALAPVSAWRARPRSPKQDARAS